MAITFNKTLKVASLQAQSSKILAIFSKTREDLTALNQTLADGIAANEAQMAAFADLNCIYIKKPIIIL